MQPHHHHHRKTLCGSWKTEAFLDRVTERWRDVSVTRDRSLISDGETEGGRERERTAFSFLVDNKGIPPQYYHNIPTAKRSRLVMAHFLCASSSALWSNKMEGREGEETEELQPTDLDKFWSSSEGGNRTFIHSRAFSLALPAASSAFCF